MVWILANSIIRVYLNCTMGYGLGRSVTYERVSTKRYMNNKTERSEVKEMLVVDKMSRIKGISCSAVIMWPVMHGNDLTRLECVALRAEREEPRGV